MFRFMFMSVSLSVCHITSKSALFGPMVEVPLSVLVQSVHHGYHTKCPLWTKGIVLLPMKSTKSFHIGYYSISLGSLYLGCNMSTNFIILFLKHHILLFCHEIFNIFCINLDRIKNWINILYFGEKQHDLEENTSGFVDISHRRYKLRRDVEQTPSLPLTIALQVFSCSSHTPAL